MAPETRAGRVRGARTTRRAGGGGEKPVELREEFDPALIAALYNNFRSSMEALMELVDNAVDDRVPGRPLVIAIRIRKGSLRMTNRGGTGMGLEELAGFLRWGGSRKQGKLGRYGQGGKAAIGYLGCGWRVQTIREAAAGNTSAGASLQGNISAGASVQGNTPAGVSAVGTAGGGLRCYAFGRLIAAGEYFGHPDATQRLALGWLAGEVHLDFVPLIMNKTDFDRDSDAWHAAARLLHERLAPLVEELSREKTPGKRVSTRERRLAQEVEALLARLLRHLAEQERLPAVDAGVPGAAEAAALSSEADGAGGMGGADGAAAETAAAAVAETAAGAAGEAAPETGDGQDHGPQGEAAPETADGADTAGHARVRRRRKRRALPIEIRPMEEHIRCQRVVRGGAASGAAGDPEEDGEEVLVVNNRYPLYRLRGGGRLYLLETAALELARSDDGVNSPEEFITELNRLLYEAARFLAAPRAPARRR